MYENACPHCKGIGGFYYSVQATFRQTYNPNENWVVWRMEACAVCRGTGKLSEAIAHRLEGTDG